MLINIDGCKGLDMKLCQLAEEKQLTDEQFRYFTKGWQSLWEMIIELPSADRLQGKWINGHRINGVYYKRCDQCFAEIEDSFFGESSFDVNFCPNCGADMRGDNDSNDI